MLSTVLFYSLSPLFFLFLYSTTVHILNRLRNLPPSPFPTLPFIGHVHLLKLPFHRSLSQISRKHGPVLFLQLGARPALLVSSPSAAEECFTDRNDVVFANRPDLLDGRHYGCNYTSLVWSPYGDHWRNLRRISSLELLSSHRLKSLARVRADEAAALVRRLRRAAEEEPRRSIGVKSALFEFMFNALTRMVLGKRYYGRKDGEKSEEAEALEEIMGEIGKLAFDATVVDYLPFVRRFGRFRRLEGKMAAVQERRDRFMQDVIDERRREMVTEEEREANGGDRKGENATMAEVLLDLQRSEPEYYTDQMIKNLLNVLLLGGTSTTTIALEWALSLLLESPKTQKKAQSEIDARVGHNRLITESDLPSLPYLRHVILETLRLHPPAPIIMPHASSAACHVAGFKVPANTILLVNAWEIHHSPKTWIDPEEFRPERFEGFDGIRDSGFKFLPFGSGRRACPAENLGILGIGLSLGLLLQCFDWEKAGEIDMREGSGGVAPPKAQPLMAKCRPRPFLADII